MRIRSTLIRLTVVASLTLLACGHAYVIPESDGVELMHSALAERGHSPTQTDYVIEDIVVCPEAGGCREPVSITLDGWDPDARVGFEYLSEKDADLPLRVDYIEADDEAALLQQTVNTSLGDQGTVVIMRWWQHETRPLAENQFSRALERELDALGL